VIRFAQPGAGTHFLTPNHAGDGGTYGDRTKAPTATRRRERLPRSEEEQREQRLRFPAGRHPTCRLTRGLDTTQNRENKSRELAGIGRRIDVPVTLRAFDTPNEYALQRVERLPALAAG